MGKQKQTELINETLELINLLNSYKLENYLGSKVQKLKQNIDSLLPVESDDNKFIVAKDKIVNSINHISDSFQNIEKMTKEAYDEISYCDNAINDVLHAIELIDSSSEKLIYYSEEIKRFRTRRRNAKNFLDVTSHFKNFACGDKNKGALNRIYNLKQSTNDKNKLTLNRTYTVRVLRDMQKDFDRQSIITIKNKGN